MAVLGMKLHPTGHGVAASHELAFSGVHREAGRVHAGMKYSNSAVKKTIIAVGLSPFVARFIEITSAL